MKDYVLLDELGVAIHLIKDGEILSDESRSSQRFVHGIKVLMARTAVENLGEEASKGLLGKGRTASLTQRGSHRLPQQSGNPPHRSGSGTRCSGGVLRQPHAEQRRLLKTLLSNCTVQGVTLCPTYRKPFDVLAKGNETGNWLGVRDSNPENTFQSQALKAFSEAKKKSSMTARSCGIDSAALIETRR